MWKAKVFTLYPEFFPGPLDCGLYKKAIDNKLWSLEVINIRDYAKNKHKTVDDTPFGGGSGMLMRADVLSDALDKNISNKNEPIIYLSPRGKQFDHTHAKKILKKNLNKPFWKFNLEKNIQIINDGGWHFNNLYSPNKISKKLQTFQHSEFEAKEFSSVDLIKSKIEKLEDLFGRNHKYEKVVINNEYPEYILNNLDLFKEHIL